MDDTVLPGCGRSGDAAGPRLSRAATRGHRGAVDHPDPWPLRHLELRTPRLSLRPDDDEGLLELASLAVRGVHPPEVMPFTTAWTDQEPAEMVRTTMQWHWAARAALRPGDWSLHFLVRRDGIVVGTQSLVAGGFAVTREVRTGSWLGTAHQRRGTGTEMRAAVLLFAFDVLDALTARSTAFTDNTASLRVSDRLGYRPDGTVVSAPRGRRAVETRLVVTPERFVRPEWALQIDGLAACRPLLGV